MNLNDYMTSVDVIEYLGCTKWAFYSKICKDPKLKKNGKKIGTKAYYSKSTVEDYKNNVYIQDLD